MRPHHIPVAATFLALMLTVSSACAARHPAQPSAAAPGVVRASREAHEYLQATLWVQTAAEYRVAAEMLFLFAREALARPADPKHSAALEQTGDCSSLPPALIVDVDETVLDNSPYHARLILENRGFDPALWGEWVRKMQGTPVPGASDFLKDAAAQGIEVFYITNRAREEEAATRRNLEAVGFPVKEGLDTVLVKDERPDWGSDKSTRRAFVARTHRIVMLVGDDLGDFVSVAQSRPEERVQVAEKHGAHWGRDWFMVPNPQYGSWERALYGYQAGYSELQILQAKKAALRPF